jgi:hypothetical protein
MVDVVDIGTDTKMAKQVGINNFKISICPNKKRKRNYHKKYAPRAKDLLCGVKNGKKIGIP